MPPNCSAVNTVPTTGRPEGCLSPHVEITEGRRSRPTWESWIRIEAEAPPRAPPEYRGGI